MICKTTEDRTFWEEFNSELREPYVNQRVAGKNTDDHWREYLINNMCLLSSSSLIYIVETEIHGRRSVSWSQVVVDTAASILLERAISDPVV